MQYCIVLFCGGFSFLVCVCMYAPRITSRDKILCFINTLFIIIIWSSPAAAGPGASPPGCGQHEEHPAGRHDLQAGPLRHPAGGPVLCPVPDHHAPADQLRQRDPRPTAWLCHQAHGEGTAPTTTTTTTTTSTTTTASSTTATARVGELQWGSVWVGGWGVTVDCLRDVVVVNGFNFAYW